jgi:hypothetical protein
MKKPFLLIAGYSYYPSSGTGDWIATYETFEDASAAMCMVDSERVGSGYKMSSDKSDWPTTYDWIKIVDLREWTED